jgi:pantetheine-phosphate adenylyltransferase
VVTTAVYAGSFDPITRGHEDLIRRSCEFVDHLIVAVAVNSSKKALFSTDERVDLIRLSTADQKCVEVTQFEGLLVDFAKRVGASLNIRGLRAVSDFEYEFQMALMNRHLSEGFETVFMVPSVETTYISSSVVREVAQHHGNLTALVHPAVADALARKFGHTKSSSTTAKVGRDRPSSSATKSSKGPAKRG